MPRDIERNIEKERFNGSQKNPQNPAESQLFKGVPKSSLHLHDSFSSSPLSPLSPDGDSHLLSIQPHLWVRKGRAKETAVAQAAQSAASEVGTRGLLFASSEGFSALMSARLSLRPGK